TYLFVGELRACTNTKTPDIAGSHAGERRFFCQDVPLTRVFGEFMTLEHWTSIGLPVPAPPA
ncbi:MAG: hypothetical protein WCC90_08665, partial [Methylocella sp.]